MMAEEEIWKPIEWSNGAYWVSNHGRVRSHLAPGGRGRSWIVMDEPQRILSTNANLGRYPSVFLQRGNDKGNRPVHRLVMEAFVGPCPDGMIVCHLDDNPQNNHLSNLRYASYADNISDSIANGKAHYARRGRRIGKEHVVGLNVTIRQSQKALINKWADKEGITRSEMVRMIIDRYADERK